MDSKQLVSLGRWNAWCVDSGCIEDQPGLRSQRAFVLVLVLQHRPKLQ